MLQWSFRVVLLELPYLVLYVLSTAIAYEFQVGDRAIAGSQYHQLPVVAIVILIPF